MNAITRKLGKKRQLWFLTSVSDVLFVRTWSSLLRRKGIFLCRFRSAHWLVRVTVKTTTRARKYTENNSNYSLIQILLSPERHCAGCSPQPVLCSPFPPPLPPSCILTDVLTVSVYGPKLKPRYSKIHKTQFPSLWRALPNGEDSKILKGTETSSVPEDETYPSLGGRRQARMASWRRWPQSCTFRVSRQVLTMKRRREAIRTGGSTWAKVWAPETESICMKKARKFVYRAHLSQGMLRVEAERGEGPDFSHPQSCFVSLIPAANIHKSWLSFLLSQGSGPH